MTRTIDDLLSLSPWAAHLSHEQRDRVREETRLDDFAADAMIETKGSAVAAWLGVVDGLVKISSVSRDGKPVTFAGIGRGGWFGEGSLLKDEPRRYDVIALRDSRVAMMPRTTFQWLLDTSLPFNRFLLDQLNERLGQFIARVEFQGLLSPDARVARCLSQFFIAPLYPGQSLQLDISQAEIGYLTGLSRQRVNQALQTLEAAGLLGVEFNRVMVRDVEGLSRFEG